MGHVKITSGKYGYVSCVIDTSFYNYCNGLSETRNTEIYRSGSFNQEGITFLSNASQFIQKIKCTVLQSISQTQYDMNRAMTLAQVIYPNANYSTCGTLPIQPNYDTDLYAGSSYFRIYQSSNHYQNNVVIDFSDSSGSSSWGDNQHCAPFGYVTTQNVFITVIVFNDDQSSCVGLRTSFFYSVSTQYITILKVTGTISTHIPQTVSWFDLPDENGDPYNGGGTTEHGGGGGSFDDTTDPQTFPPVPTLSVTNVKFVKLYTPTESELIGISSWLWSNDFNLDNLKKLFANPMDCILGLSVVPVLPDHGTPDTVVVGNISAPNTVLARPITNQYKIKNFGTLNVEEYWGSYLDYDPYTKIEIYLPFIGIEQISTDDVMGKTIELQYNIDVLSGACVAMLMCNNNILYQFAGNCAMGLPLVGRDMLSVITGIVNVVSKGVTAIGGIATGNASGITSAVTAMSSASTDAMRSKRNIQKSGSISGTAGFMGVMTPYLIITRPRQALPDMQSTFTGYPSFITKTLSTCEGFTTVQSVHLENIPATATEISEIETILMQGVIF